MPLDPSQVGRLATALAEDMEREYGSESVLTAVIAIAAVKDARGHVYIQHRAADGDGDGLAPWHVKGILNYIDQHVD